MFCHIFRVPVKCLYGRHHQLHQLLLYPWGHRCLEDQGRVDGSVVDVGVGHVMPVGGVLSVVEVLTFLNLVFTTEARSMSYLRCMLHIICNI